MSGHTPFQSLHHPNSSQNNHPFTGSSNGSAHNSIFTHLASRHRSNKARLHADRMSSPSTSQQQPSPQTYAESTYSTTSTLEPLMGSSKSGQRSSLRTKTKKFLSSLGEPPTAAWDREQARLAAERGGPLSVDATEKQRRMQMASSMDYGLGGRGGPFSARGSYI